MRLRGTYYDGKSARALAVDVLEHHQQVWIRGDDFERIESLSNVRIGEQVGSAPRIVRYADGAHVEINDHDGFAFWLKAIGYRETVVDMAQRSVPMALLSLLLVVFAGIAAYQWGLPYVAKQLAERVPTELAGKLSEGTLSVLDKHVLAPSELPVAEQARLQSRFRALDQSGSARLLFRSARKLGPNALALPDGTVIVLDALVRLAENDEEVLGVLAHELAHFEQRHGLRAMIDGSVTGAFFAWWLGDFSPLIAAAPVGLLQAQHSRKLEAEADLIAATKLADLGISASHLATMLEKLGSAQGLMQGRKNDDTSGAEKEAEESEHSWLDYLSTHPATAARLKALRELAADGSEDQH